MNYISSSQNKSIDYKNVIANADMDNSIDNINSDSKENRYVRKHANTAT